MPDWTDTEIQALKANWKTSSASKIGRALGRSRNSIIGKANRMGLAPKLVTEAQKRAARLRMGAKMSSFR